MRALFTAASLLLTLALSSCGPQAPRPPQPGSPAFLWNAAQQAFTKGNFLDASTQLDRLATKESEFKTRAKVLNVVVALGIARADMEWADLLDEGGKLTRDKQIVFRKAMNTARVEADQMTMRAAEITHKDLAKLKDAELTLAFALPQFATDLPIEAERVKKGVALTDAENEGAHLKMVQRGVLKTYADFVGSPKDIAKARELVAAGGFKLTKDLFLMGVARNYAELTALYAPKKLDKAGQVKMLIEETTEALGFAAASPEGKAIEKKLDEAKKKLPKS